MLSDPRKRAIFDKYGENGLKGQVPPADAGASHRGVFHGGASRAGGGGTAFYSSGDFPASAWFNPRSADDVFAEFFGCSDSGGGMRSSTFSFSEEAFRTSGGGGGGGGETHASRGGGPLKAAPIEKKLPCTLEELYNGTTKRMKISREIFEASG